MSGWVDGCHQTFFQIATLSTVLVQFLQKLAHMIYVPIGKKTVGQIFKIFGEFFKF